MNETFDWCVKLLEDWARYTHMTYKEINIRIFVIIEPIVFVVMLYIMIRQWSKIRKMKKTGSF